MTSVTFCKRKLKIGQNAAVDYYRMTIIERKRLLLLLLVNRTNKINK